MTRGALVATIVFALATVVAAAVHASPALVGGCAAVAAAAIAVACGATARALGAPDDVREPRVDRGPTEAEPRPPEIPRRTVFGRLWLVALSAVGVTPVIPLLALERHAPRRGTAWSRGARLVTADGAALRASDLAAGGVETVFPQGKVGAPESAVLLVRLEDGVAPRRPERSGWSPQGNIAYSKICTHAGCPVAIYRHAAHQLYCPCHQSVFDVLDAARPISGPATRALPQLPLDVDADGYLIAQDDFGEPVGPDEWWRTV